MKMNAEKLNELVDRLNSGDFEFVQGRKDNSIHQMSRLVVALQEVPQSKIVGDLNRVKDQLFTRIKAYEVKDRKFGFVLQSIPKILRVSSVSLAALLLFVSLTVGTTVAASQSVPGDSIYPLKKVVEKIQLKLARNDNQRAVLQLQFAYNRLEELQSVIDKQDDGRISKDKAEELLVQVVSDISNNTKAVTNSNVTKPTIVAKLTELSNKLKTAAIDSEGQVKIELQQAMAAAKISKDQAIKNLERAGMKIENELVLNDMISNQVSMSGRISLVAEQYIVVGNTRIYIDNNTKFFGGTLQDAVVDKSVDIIFEIRENKSYALQVVINPNPEGTVEGLVKDEEVQEDNTTDGIIRIPEGSVNSGVEVSK